MGRNGGNGWRIVLTGGPGGGKTTAADLFRREIGERVVVVPEAATLLFAGGFPRSAEVHARQSLQAAIYHVQRTPQFSFANFQFKENTPYYYIALGYAIFSLIVVQLLERSKIGRYLVALREEEDAAESLGVDVFKYKMIAIFISAFMTSLAGAFYTNYLYSLHPGTMMSMAFSIEIILRPIIGGMGTVLGPVIGSFLITPLAELSRIYFAKAGYEGLHLVIYGFLLVAVVLFFPRGVISYIKKALSGKLAKQN